MKKHLFSSLLDEMIIFIISVVGLGLVELILRIIGFTMVTPSIFLLIIFFIANVLYYPLLESGKYNTTLGKRILKLDDAVVEKSVDAEEGIEEVQENIELLEEVNETEANIDENIEDTIVESELEKEDETKEEV